MAETELVVETPQAVGDDPKPAPEPEQTATQEPEPQQEKLLTQAEVDAIVEKRLAKERRRNERKFEELQRQYEIDAAVRADRERREAKPQSDQTPKREDYESLEEYLEAKADWKVEQKLAERDQRDQSRRQEEAAQHQARQLAETWAERAAKAAETYPDFDEVASNPELPISTVMAQAIQDSDLGIEVAYHLGKHPTEALRIARLAPLAQIREIGRLEAAIAKPVAKPVSKAAAPIEPITASGEGGRKSISDPNLSVEEYVKLRRKSNS